MDTQRKRGDGGLRHISAILPEVLAEIGASGVLEVSTDDVRKMRAVRDLCESTDPIRRATHLGEWAAAMAERMEQAIGRAA